MSDSWEAVRTTSMMEARIFQAVLESAEIPVVLKGEAVGQIYGLTATELGEVQVLVPGDRAEEARRLLDEARPLNFPADDLPGSA